MLGFAQLRCVALVLAILSSATSAPALDRGCVLWLTRAADRFALVPEQDRSGRAQELLESCPSGPGRTPYENFARAAALVHLHRFREAELILRPLAALEDAEAARLLADVLSRDDEGRDARSAEAKALYERLAAAGDSDAAEGLALALWSQAPPSEDNRTRAIALLKAAETAGSSSAPMRLGVLLTRDGGQRFAVGLAALERAVTKGNNRARVVLADLLARGVGIASDQERAASLLEEAANRGDAEAQVRLGRMWEKGWGVGPKWNKDVKRAVALYRQAADQGHVPALLELGTVLAFGHDGEYDPKSGQEAFAKAAGQGSLEASERLGVLYELGVGVPTDLDKAREHYSSAAKKYARPAVALTRLDPANAAAWAAEEQRLKALELPTEASPDDESNARRFLRGKASGLSFEALERLTLTLHDAIGRRVFSEVLLPGDTVRLDPTQPEYLSISAYPGESGRRLAVLRASGHELPISAPERYSWQHVLAKREDALVPAEMPSLPDSEVVLRAFSGPVEAVEIYDPDFAFERRGLGERPPSPWTRPSARLEEPKEVKIPDLPVVEMRVEGGTDIAIASGSDSLARVKVPTDAVLYLRLPRELLRGPFSLVARNSEKPLRLEFDYERGERDAVFLLSRGIPVGWIYKPYVTASDGVIAPFVPGVFESFEVTSTLLPDWDAVFRLSRGRAFMAIRDHGRQSSAFLSALQMSARALTGQGRTEEAIESLETVISGSRALLGPRSELYADALLELAGLYQRNRDLSRALALARRAVASYGRLPSGYTDRRNDSTLRKGAAPISRGNAHRGYESALRFLAKLFDEAGRYDLALLYHHQLAALALRNSRNDQFGAGSEHYLAIADLELRRGDRQASRISAEVAVWSAKASFGVSGLPDPLPTPIPYPSGFARLFGPIDRSMASSQSLTMIGDAYLLAGRPLHYAEPLYAMALTAAMNTNGAGSTAALRGAAGLVKTRAQTMRDSEAVALLRGASGYDEATGAFPPFLAVDRAARLLFFDAYLAALRRANERNGGDATALARDAAAVFFAEENEELARSFDLGRDRLRATDDRQRRVLEEWIAAKSEFDRLRRRLLASETASGVPRAPLGGLLSGNDALRGESEAARKRLLTAEREAAAAFPNRVVSDPQAGLARARSLLAADEAVMLLLPLRESIAVLILTRDSLTLSTVSKNDFELSNEITAFRRALDPAWLTSMRGDDPFASVDLMPLVALRDATIGQFVASAENKPRLIVIPHGVLRNIPLEAVPLEAPANRLPATRASSVRWAGFEYEIAYLPSLRALIELRSNFPTSKATRPFAAVADPILEGDPRLLVSAALQTMRDFREHIRRWFSDVGFLDGAKLKPIEGTGRLVETLRSVLGGRTDDVFTGARASRRDILASDALQNARVIAFATHGLTADDDTVKSGEPMLVLTSTEKAGAVDGLAASEISRLRLDADLVLLSACSTAGPSGEPGGQGFSGLTQAFLTAGARSVIATHWMVRSDAAELFSTETLLHAAQHGFRLGEAVRLSRQKVMARLPHPAFWASFVFVGDPSLSLRARAH